MIGANERRRKTVTLLLISRDHEGWHLFLSHNLVLVLHILNGLLTQIFTILNVLRDTNNITAEINNITIRMS